MTWRKFIAVVEISTPIAVIAFLALAFPTMANAQQPPRKGCYAVDKREYDSARKKNLLNIRFGTYVRTGRVLRRYYWFCP
jgi:hypothetical protein